MQPSYNHHAIGMQYSCSYGRTSTGKEIPIEYLGETLVLEQPKQVLEIAIVDRYSIKIDLEVRPVDKTKTKDRPSFKIRVLH